jgi:hypothetical protein
LVVVSPPLVVVLLVVLVIPNVFRDEELVLDEELGELTPVLLTDGELTYELGLVEEDVLPLPVLMGVETLPPAMRGSVVSALVIDRLPLLTVSPLYLLSLGPDNPFLA